VRRPLGRAIQAPQENVRKTGETTTYCIRAETVSRIARYIEITGSAYRGNSGSLGVQTGTHLVHFSRQWSQPVRTAGIAEAFGNDERTETYAAAEHPDAVWFYRMRENWSSPPAVSLRESIYTQYIVVRNQTELYI
jgi:hypothetical protein